MAFVSAQVSFFLLAGCTHVNRFSNPDEVRWTLLLCFAEATYADQVLKTKVATSSDDTDAVATATLLTGKNQFSEVTLVATATLTPVPH